MVAEDNARALQADNIRFLVSDWYEDLPVGLCFNLIVSNPPYIAEGDPHLVEGDLRFEPIDALTDHEDGLATWPPSWRAPLRGCYRAAGC
jgi:release factor glutamine methyltransferase